MKKRWLHILSFLCLFAPAYSWAQCDSEAFFDKCDSLGDFKFVTANKVKIDQTQQDKVEYPQLLSNENTYIMSVCHEGPGNMMVELYDRSHKLIMSNYDKSQRKYLPSINYTCSATGIYYLAYSFVGADINCGIGIIGVK